MAQDNIRKMAVLGDPSTVSGFAGLGLEVLAVTAEVEPAALLKEACESRKYAAIYVTEDLLKACASVIERYREAALPVIVPIPGAKGSSGEAGRKLQAAVRRAVGFDIQKKAKE